MVLEQGLPRSTFAKLSPHPYLLAHLDAQSESSRPTRSSGRAPNESRKTSFNKSNLSHAQGSSLIRIGDTTAICGVRTETILTEHIPNYRASNTETELRDYDLLVPNIELSTGCAPQFLPGGPPSTLAQTLSTRLYTLLHSSKLIDPKDLRIWHKKPLETSNHDEDAMEEEEVPPEEAEEYVVAYWVLFIDIFFMSYDGNPFDAAWGATLAALRNTKIPQARYDPDRELIMCSRNDPRHLGIRGTPIACTAVAFTGKETTDQPTEGKYWLLVDPDALEETLCEESVTIVLDCAGGSTKILSISKHGGVSLTPQLLSSKEFLGWATQRWKDFATALEGPQ